MAALSIAAVVLLQTPVCADVYVTDLALTGVERVTEAGVPAGFLRVTITARTDLRELVRKTGFSTYVRLQVCDQDRNTHGPLTSWSVALQDAHGAIDKGDAGRAASHTGAGGSFRYFFFIDPRQGFPGPDGHLDPARRLQPVCFELRGLKGVEEDVPERLFSNPLTLSKDAISRALR